MKIKGINTTFEDILELRAKVLHALRFGGNDTVSLALAQLISFIDEELERAGNEKIN